MAERDHAELLRDFALEQVHLGTLGRKGWIGGARLTGLYVKGAVPGED
jgi:hypothetical protein